MVGIFIDEHTRVGFYQCLYCLLDRHTLRTDTGRNFSQGFTLFDQMSFAITQLALYRRGCILRLFRLCLGIFCFFIVDSFFTRIIRNICRCISTTQRAVNPFARGLTVYLRGSICGRRLLTNAGRTVALDRVISRIDDCGIFSRLRAGTDLENQHRVFDGFSRTDIDDGTIARSVDAGSEVGIGYGSFAAVKQCLCFFSSYGDVAGKRLTQMRLNI